VNINNSKQFLFGQLLWMGISFGLSFAVSLLLPFPVSILAIFGIFILFNMYMRKTMLKRMNTISGTKIFGSMSPMPNASNDSSLKFYCMSCGTQHKKVACPSCGSKMKKVGF
jgi:hypothetical protein